MRGRGALVDALYARAGTGPLDARHCRWRALDGYLRGSEAGARCRARLRRVAGRVFGRPERHANSPDRAPPRPPA